MSLQNHGVDAAGLMAGASALAQPAEHFGNDSRVEALWAMRAMEHAEVYFNILCSVDPREIPRLSPCDDRIYTKFRADFPDFEVKVVEEPKLKSEEAKKVWRAFCEDLKDVEDYSLATLLRLDSSKDYSEENSIIVTKIQFYAIELARNKEGHNQSIRENFKPSPRSCKKKVKDEEANGNNGNVNMSEVEFELKQILGGHHPLLK